MKNKEHGIAFHLQTVEEVLRELSSGVNGISGEEARIRLEKFGFNEIPEKKAKNPVLIFLKQFKSVLIYILLIAAAISFLIGHLIDVFVILVIILINAVIGFTQEYRAERSIRALKKMIVLYAKVYREGELLQIPARMLVAGDIILLDEGDRVPGDARLVETKNFRTVEASLTGESFPVDKDIRALPEKTAVSDCKNMVWMGTFVAGGHAKAVVCATGAGTQLGKLAQDIENINAVKGHFEEKTDKLAMQMGIIAVIGASLIFLIGFFVRGFEFTEILLFTTASLVSGIPEGLSAVLIIVLAIGAHRMAKRNAIIRTLPATETLGVVNVIMTDKTGTLTENTMNVEKIIMPDENEITISGEGWKPAGSFYQNTDIIFPLENPHLAKLLHIAAVCNNAKLMRKSGEEEDYEIIGDPTEAALVVLVEKAGLKEEVLREKEKRIDDLPFNSELKYRASLLVMGKNNKKEIYVIGAPEEVLSYSRHFLEKGEHKKLSEKHRQSILSQVESLTNKAMRVLALAYLEVSDDTNNLSENSINNLVFAGIVGMMDPPRPEVKDAVEKAKNAGIRVIMATGDHKSTAIAIATHLSHSTIVIN